MVVGDVLAWTLCRLTNKRLVNKGYHRINPEVIANNAPRSLNLEYCGIISGHPDTELENGTCSAINLCYCSLRTEFCFHA